MIQEELVQEGEMANSIPSDGPATVMEEEEHAAMLQTIMAAILSEDPVTSTTQVGLQVKNERSRTP